jgi:uncharacterized membrane protein
VTTPTDASPSLLASRLATSRLAASRLAASRLAASGFVASMPSVFDEASLGPVHVPLSTHVLEL